MTDEVMSPEEKLSSILNGFFLNEPLFFNVYCTHRLEKNSELLTVFRSGNGIIQYNPKFLETLSVKDVEKYLKVELYRILLKHPYQRMPENPNPAALTKSSDVVIDGIDSGLKGKITSAREYELISGYCFEEYYKWFKYYFQHNSIGRKPESGVFDEPMLSQEAASQQSGLWNENEEIQKAINYEIQKAEKTGNWGSISHLAVEEIKATMEIKLDYKQMLSHFHKSILSEKRKLTRMRPNRRYEDYMGSAYDMKVSLLVAVDDSGSITSHDLESFLSVINRIFKYGINSIHVITFDEKLQDEFDIKKAEKKYVVNGRGETNFNIPLDYFKAHPEYSGMIVFTDGYAEYPVIRQKLPVMWMFTSRASYEYSKDRFTNVNGSRGGWIPRG